LKAQSNRLADELAVRGRADFMADFARKLPSLGLCELIGVPAEDREQFTQWADTIGLGFNPMLMAARISDIDSALVALLDYADKLIAARREAPRDDLVTRIAQAVENERALPESLVRGSVAGLVFAGHETTKNQLGWMITILSEVPAEWDRVAAQPERAPALIEEVLRFRSTATSIGRKAVADLEIEGAKIPAGALVMGSLWGANTDPAAFAEPNRLSVEANDKNPQLAFGHGPHHCLGAALARAELQEALIALSARITCPRVEDGATFLPPLGINGPLTLPIAFSSRSQAAQ
jgi:cytochrome P450